MEIINVVPFKDILGSLMCSKPPLFGLSQIKPIRNLQSHFFNIHFNIILLPTSRSPKSPKSLKVSN
jgi:hypothetical protein